MVECNLGSSCMLVERNMLIVFLHFVTVLGMPCFVISFSPFFCFWAMVIIFSSFAIVVKSFC